MTDLMRFKGGEVEKMSTAFEDAFLTMQAVEKAYICNDTYKQ
jgi:hypothetical protein